MPGRKDDDCHYPFVGDFYDAGYARSANDLKADPNERVPAKPVYEKYDRKGNYVNKIIVGPKVVTFYRMQAGSMVDVSHANTDDAAAVRKELATRK